MTEPLETDKPRADSQPHPDPAQQSRLLDDVGELGSRVADLARQGATLLQAESKLFVLALGWILALLVCAGLLLASALIALLLAALAALVQSGWLSWTLAPLLAAVVLLLLVAVVLSLVRLLSRDLAFRRSRQLLQRADTERVPP